MAAEVLAQGGVGVDLYDAKPSVGRKFLVAGKGGLNLTHAEPYDQFLARYGPRRDKIKPLLDAFGPEQLRQWARDLGFDTFVGTSGRVFPVDMQAAPLLRAWLHRLRQQGVCFHMRHRWAGWDEDGALRFETPEGDTSVEADAVILALGGGSWAKLGSDGAWVSLADPTWRADCAAEAGQLRLRRGLERPLSHTLPWSAHQAGDAHLFG